MLLASLYLNFIIWVISLEAWVMSIIHLSLLFRIALMDPLLQMFPSFFGRMRLAWRNKLWLINSILFRLMLPICPYHKTLVDQNGLHTISLLLLPLCQCLGLCHFILLFFLVLIFLIMLALLSLCPTSKQLSSITL